MPQSLAHKLWHMSWGDRLVIGEAVISLAIARLIVVFVPFRRVPRLTARPFPSKSHSASDLGQAIGRVRWAVTATSGRVPWRALCFEQGLAAHLMLRSRGIASILYCGAAPDKERGLIAHVWLRAGGIDVVGGELAARFAELAAFPPADDAPAR
jgi:hypothetical protein